MFGSDGLGLRAGDSNHLATTWRDPWTRSPDRPDVLPDDLESWEPGPFLAVVMSSVNRSRLCGYDLVRLLQAEGRLVSHFQAGLYQSIVEIGTVADDADSGAAEVSARISKASARRYQMGQDPQQPTPPGPAPLAEEPEERPSKMVRRSRPSKPSSDRLARTASSGFQLTRRSGAIKTNPVEATKAPKEPPRPDGVPLAAGGSTV